MKARLKKKLRKATAMFERIIERTPRGIMYNYYWWRKFLKKRNYKDYKKYKNYDTKESII